MTRDEAVATLRAHAREIRALGVKSVGLFGSVARNEAGSSSDVDVLVEFQGRATLDAYMDLRDLLERILGRRVDLVTRGALKPMLRPYVEHDLVHVA
jgi:predicted nucleotidyltransferase